MASNKGSNYAFQNEVVLAFNEAGLTGVRRRRELKGLPPAAKVRGDLIGCPVTTAIRNGQRYDLAAALAEARAEAAAEHAELYVSIQSRRGRSVEDSFVVTDLRCWLRVLARLHPELVRMEDCA